MITRNGYALAWTVDNLPESIASAQGNSTFSYGPDGNRYSQSATFNGSTTATAYIGGLFEVVSTSTDTEYRHNIVADGQVIAVHTINQSGSAYTDYLHYDHLGSVDAITNDSGSVIQAMSFDAFGVRRDASNWDYDLSQNTIATLKNYTDRGYTDQEQLDNLSLVDLNGRVYDPTVGRVISADPTVPDAFYSQAFNRFAYVYDSPLVYTDPSGFGGALPCEVPEAISSGGSVIRSKDDPCELGPAQVTYPALPPAPSLNSTNTITIPGDGQQPGADNGPDPGKNKNDNSKQPTNSKQQPQNPKQQPKKECNQSHVDALNHDYAFGEGMIKTGLAGEALAAGVAEVPTPQTEVVAGSLAVVSAGEATVGIAMQGMAGWELYKETGDITPFRNSVVGYSQSLVDIPPSVAFVAATAMSSILGQQQATCPNQ